ncbi:hypothetical protein [Streptomyces sp. NPDC096324]|uniref:hypothetical protein n=1 Tax=Streptomyces sp. NPDC096324 TaxID=3366085 RepID=UPI003826127F
MSQSRRRRLLLAAMAAGGLLLSTSQSATAAVAGGNVLVSWSIPNAPSAGLTNITFPMTVNRATAHRDGIYAAQQYNFRYNSGYTGLQPRADRNGHERLHGVFSVFGSGASTSDPNCYQGADGGAGVSCAVDFDGVYGRQYSVTVARTGSDTWTGTATDTVTNVSVHIGTYRVPSGSGNLQASQVGFVEYYLGVPSCSTIPRSDVVFGGPTTTDAGGLSGTSKAVYEYGACVGSSNFHAEQVGSGTHITRGYNAGGVTQGRTK